MITLFQIHDLSKSDNEYDLVEYLMEVGGIPASKKCPNGHEMSIRKDGKSLKWRCNGKISIPKKKTTTCNYGCSIRQGS